MAVIGIANWLVLSTIDFPKRDLHHLSRTHRPPDNRASLPSRPLRQILSQPLFIIACCIATLAHTVMVMVMSSCVLAMDEDGFSFTRSAYVLQLHFLCMFSPGFFSGHLIHNYGGIRVAILGTFVYAACAVILAIGSYQWNYFVGMGLLGVAWNFSYSAATIMVTECYLVRDLNHPCPASHMSSSCCLFAVLTRF
jgi:MFS family permease